MATIPDWKLQLLGQEEASVRGREMAERERLSQMPAWKRGLLERRRAKLGLPPGDPSPVLGTAEAGPPDPDESAVLLEAIGPVHQNRFIRQERQQQMQRSEELLLERRPSPGEMRDQSPRAREAREERLSPRETRGRRLGAGGARESSPRPSEARDWRQSPGDGGDRSSRPLEARKWRLSPGETPERSLRLVEPREQSPRRTEAAESRLSPGESGHQKLGLTEAHKWRPDSREPQDQSSVPLEASEWRPGSEERKNCLEECGRKERRMATVETARLSETLAREAPDSSPRGVEAAEPRPSLVEDGESSVRPSEGWRWTLSSGKARAWTPRDSEIHTQTPEPPEAAEKRLGPPGVEGEGGEPEPEPEPEEAGAQGRPLRAPQSRSSAPFPLPPEDAGTGGPRQQEEEAVATADPAVPGAGKKRYPTAEEILVLGGYLRLSRSCLAKGSPERHHKQLKISFSETALETTYQYPSESSVLEELGPEPEAPSAPSPPAAQPDDDDDEEELLLQRELQGGLRTKALIVDESCRR
ncbi:phostensin [Tupaia chinensis]|uniref:phostensin n=1 Tax=Tupaia chinensis TaxID=246437 RepID=UPI0003C8F25C|nr:phostensin [Tupaia chinensis]